VTASPAGRKKAKPSGEVVGWKPDARCPSCGRCPDVRFSEAEVLRAKVDRQRAHVMEVTCTRESCRQRYWIQAGDIARSKLVRGKVDADRSVA
jgi:hypothetical protein